MQILSLRCNNCGANLEIAPKIKFVTCTFCNSSLAIKHTNNAAFTEVLDEIKDNTGAILRNTELIRVGQQLERLEQQLERLEQNWKSKRETFSKANSNVGEGLGGPFVLVVGFMVLLAAFLGEGPWFTYLVGFAVVGAGGYYIHYSWGLPSEKTPYQRAQGRYLSQRRAILKKIQQYKSQLR
ncbi:MAG: hypothetical protein AB8F95_21790 [Bacteroidia bacterium]